jgi:hypothetical protein
VCFVGLQRLQVKVDVATDPARVLQPTRSLLAAPLAQDPVFAAVNGYSTEQIVADKRFRAAERLRTQGLAHLPAARDALRAMHAQTMPRRPDILCTDQRAAMGMLR